MRIEWIRSGLLAAVLGGSPLHAQSQDFELTLRPDWEQLGLIEYACEANNRCAGGECSEDSPP
jgi:hypothetical protein